MEEGCTLAAGIPPQLLRHPHQPQETRGIVAPNLLFYGFCRSCQAPFPRNRGKPFAPSPILREFIFEQRECPGTTGGSEENKREVRLQYLLPSFHSPSLRLPFFGEMWYGVNNPTFTPDTMIPLCHLCFF